MPNSPNANECSPALADSGNEPREIPNLDFVLAELDAAATTIETHFASLHPAREIPDHLRRTYDRLTAALYRG